MRIVQVGEIVLRQKARALVPDEIRGREIQDLIASMRETMYKAPGVGLAAPQVGVPVQLAVIEDKAEYTKDVPGEVMAERERKPVAFQVIINPVLTLQPGETREFFEGCLSLPGFTAVVPRARSVKVDYLDHRGQRKTIAAIGWHARILQHEIDHLQGTIYIDRMETRTFASLENFAALSKDRTTAEVRRLLRQET